MLSKNPAERPDVGELEMTLPQLLELLEQKMRKEEAEKAKEDAEKAGKMLQAAEKNRDASLITEDEESIARNLSNEIEKIKRRAYRINRPDKKNFREFALRWGILSAAALFSLMLGLLIYSMMWSDGYKAPRGANVVIIGLESGKMEEKRILDINNAKLDSTGEKAGYAYECEKCGRKFPVTPQAGGKSSDPDKIFSGIFHKCPSCGSFFTEPVKTQNEKILSRK